MLKALKQRISELKKDENWRERKYEKQDKETTVRFQDQDERPEPVDMYDKISQNLSQNDEQQSVTSEKTQSKERMLLWQTRSAS